MHVKSLINVNLSIKSKAKIINILSLLSIENTIHQDILFWCISKPNLANEVHDYMFKLFQTNNPLI